MYENLYDQIDEALDQIQSGRVDQGLAQLQMVMTYAKQDPDLAFQLADIFYELGHADTALSLIRDIEPFFDELSTDSQIEIHTLRAEMMIDTGNYDEAMDELLSCLELEPDHIRSAILLADIYLMQNLPEIACRYLEGIMESNPDEQDVAFILTEIYVEMGEWEKALRLLDTLEDSEYRDRIWVSKGKIYCQRGNFEQAYTFFKQALQEYQSGTDSLVGCALTSLQLDQTEETIMYANQLLKLDRDHMGAYQMKGEALLKENRLEEAKEVYEQALAKNDQEEAFLLKLTEVSYLLGDLDEAERFVDLVLETDDENEIALQWKERLNQRI